VRSPGEKAKGKESW